MGKKSKADWTKEADELQTMFKLARNKEHNCAILIADEGLVIVADPRLPADRLWLTAKKKDGATPKGITGKLNVNGMTLVVTCDSQPPGNMEMKFRQYMSSLKLQMKSDFQFATPGGGQAPAETPAPDSASSKPTLVAGGDAGAGGGAAGAEEAPASSDEAAAGISEDQRKARLGDLDKLHRKVDDLLASLA